ncbi:hypothetical protein [Bacteroides oleiciplenus]|uniref:DUF5043 domain-containing protein n=1 Tax=Bacteroides oleiciplenus TaxID=626931 RepID=A0A3E5BI00_9BACE|nr:hypothetical protein [Bacteroides oleiciplenus]RGN37220.1 hypothetical protein DXB65_06855 [Bacteroides oleiciplenus]
MKNIIILFIVVISSITTALGQKTTEHFVYEMQNSGYTYITPKGEVNHVLTKGQAILENDFSYQLPWHDDARVKPFQELIDSGFFSKQRMHELEKSDRTTIEVFFDETGTVSYIHFVIAPKEESLLTDNELYQISQKYKGIIYDMTHVSVVKSETGSKTSFYAYDMFKIPFKDLKY